MPLLLTRPLPKGKIVELSHRVNAIKESPTLAITAKAQKLKAEGRDVVALAAGEPDFDTPANISDAGAASPPSLRSVFAATSSTQ